PSPPDAPFDGPSAHSPDPPFWRPRSRRRLLAHGGPGPAPPLPAARSERPPQEGRPLPRSSPLGRTPPPADPRGTKGPPGSSPLHAARFAPHARSLWRDAPPPSPADPPAPARAACARTL